MSAKIISIFNNKGGVWKTTLTFHLGWMLSNLGKRVLLVDCDSQCNLTGLSLNYAKIDFSAFERDYIDSNKTLYDGIAPVIEGEPIKITNVDCVELNNNLLLLPGSVRIAEIEATLSIAQNLSNPSFQALKNIPWSFSYLITETAKHYNIDYVLLDLSPSLSALNQNLLMFSNYFLLPINPDLYSYMALRSVSEITLKWSQWFEQMIQSSVFKTATYPLPKNKSKFLWTVVSKFQPYRRVPAKAFKQWIDKLSSGIDTLLYPAMKDTWMTNLVHAPKPIIEIKDFKTLIAKSQQLGKPIFELEAENFSFGKARSTATKNIDDCRELYNKLADFVIKNAL